MIALKIIGYMSKHLQLLIYESTDCFNLLGHRLKQVIRNLSLAAAPPYAAYSPSTFSPFPFPIWPPLTQSKKSLASFYQK